MRTRPVSRRGAAIPVLGFLLTLPAPSAAAGPTAASGPAKPTFTEAAAASGITFRHVSGATTEKNMIEDMGSGVCVLDYDADGDPDLYFVQSGPVRGAASARPANALYRNDGKGRFADVTRQAGVAGYGYGMGCAAGDYDNDGRIDLYVTNFGSDILYRNNGDGTFRDVTKQAGASNPLWSTSAAFADYDGDGRLDLLVANYVDFTLDHNKWCGDPMRKIRAYCHPDAYEGVPDTLYHNNGDGTFGEVTRQAGLTEHWGKGLGVVWSDFDLDGDLDVYVAKDSVPGVLYRNNGNGTFTDVTLESGTGYSEDGRPEAGMGVDSGDYDNDGRFDIVVTNLSGEPNELWRNLGGLRFEVATFPAGIGEISIPFVGFGTNFFDSDNDGDQDLFVTNGHIIDNIKQFNDSLNFEQRAFLFDNQGNGKLREVGPDRGPYFSTAHVGRGMAVADLDGDGDLDIVLNNRDSPAVLLRNDGGNRNHFLRLRLSGRRSNRDAIGARAVVTVGKKRQIDEIRSGTSYLSQNELILHFGLGDSKSADRVEIRWPSGAIQTLQNVAADQTLAITEPSAGTKGRPSATSP